MPSSSVTINRINREYAALLREAVKGEEEAFQRDMPLAAGWKRIQSSDKVLIPSKWGIVTRSQLRAYEHLGRVDEFWQQNLAAYNAAVAALDGTTVLSTTHQFHLG